MKAITIYQPWATLIMVGAKPYEFRHWDYGERFPDIVGTRVVIHASARVVKLKEIVDLLERIEEDGGEGTALDPAKAVPLLERVRATIESGGLFVRKDVETLELPLGAALGTATITRARRAGALFSGTIADSSRIDQHVFAWPLQAIEPFKSPLPCRGLQGFWNFPVDLEREAGLRK